MMGREVSNRTFPEIGVSEPHHPLSHHQKKPEKLATKAKVDLYHVQMFAYFLEKLRLTPDGDGSLLDHVMNPLWCRYQRRRPAQPHQPPCASGGRGSR